MINLEKYKGKIVARDNGDADCCVFKLRTGNNLCELDECTDCRKENVEWLLEEYKETETGWMNVEKGSVVQINEKFIGGDWTGCLFIVDEVKEWGVLASLKIPNRGIAYLRIPNGEYDVIGMAALVPQEEEADD